MHGSCCIQCNTKHGLVNGAIGTVISTAPNYMTIQFHKSKARTWPCGDAWSNGPSTRNVAYRGISAKWRLKWPFSSGKKAVWSVFSCNHTSEGSTCSQYKILYYSRCTHNPPLSAVPLTGVGGGGGNRGSLPWVPSVRGPPNSARRVQIRSVHQSHSSLASLRGWFCIFDWSQPALVLCYWCKLSYVATAQSAS